MTYASPHGPDGPQAGGAFTHVRRTSRPESAMCAVCFGISDFDIHVFGIENVFMSAENVHGLNCTLCGATCSSDVPFGGAPKLPHSEPSHVIVPSVRAAWISLFHESARPFSAPVETTPH